MGNTALDRLAAICERATRAHGADWHALRSRIREELSRLPADQHDAISEAVRQTLAVTLQPDLDRPARQ